MTTQESTQPWEMWQKAFNEPFMIYVKSMEVFFIPNQKMQKELVDTWSNMWFLPQTNMLSLPKPEEETNSNSDYFNQMCGDWSTFGMEPFKWYMEFFQKNFELWMNFWKKSIS